MNFPELSCLSCAKQVVRVVYSCTVKTSRCNEPWSSWQIHPINVQHQPVVLDDLQRFDHRLMTVTDETPSAKRNKEGNAIDEESATPGGMR